MSTDTTLLMEIRDRMVRVESRLVQLGDYVGANLRTRQKIDITRTPRAKGETGDSGLTATVDSLDVSIARIYAEIGSAGYVGKETDVYVEGEHVATLYPKTP
jgi:hypothetical protein